MGTETGSDGMDKFVTEDILLAGAIPKCCVTTYRAVSPRLLRRAQNIEVQSGNGFCDISALIIHVKGRKYCMHLSVKKTLERMK
ncbi:hypothetical protein SKAU_G00016420 [Synaphobranchus kaupii]|uniref:Chemokine interleukin-8-like domain-containing protein n=1 Tax=Synaphobranchus kaupii TaxID=118154 RepID=A0A9Q1JE08_SYNKA|nr:hypothetical protein SKAU_G00016420 [Synaphobranchus kaupii]